MKSCPVCGSELKPLFSSLQCFNDNCGGDRDKYIAWASAYAAKPRVWVPLPSSTRMDSEAAVNEWAERDSGFGGSVWVWTDNNGVTHKVIL